MTKSDIEEVMYDACRCFGVKIQLLPNMPYSEIEDDRIVIIVGRSQPTTYWVNTTVRVNWCIPNIGGEADSNKLKRVEQMMREYLEYHCDTYKGERYKYKLSSFETLEDKDMRCFFANTTIIFQQLNIKNNDKRNRHQEAVVC